LLYARPEAQRLLKPLVVSWGWENEKPGPSRFQDLYRWTGTDDPSAYLAVPAAIAFQELYDWKSVRWRCHELASRTRARIHALSGMEPICPDSPAWFGQMVTARLPDDVNVAEVSKALWEQYRIEAPVFVRDGRAFTRVSFQAYNSEADADRLVAALETLLLRARCHVAPA
jgi:isopenicillin-N epimerase